MNARQHRQAGRNALAGRAWALTSARLNQERAERLTEAALAQLEASRQARQS
jgi:hypothetical protein